MIKLKTKMNRHPYDFINPNVDPFASDKRDKNPFNLTDEFEYIRKRQIPYNRFSYKPTFYNTSDFVVKCDEKQFYHIYQKDNNLKHVRKLCNNECFFNITDDFDYSNITNDIHNNLEKCQVCYSIYIADSKHNNADKIVNTWNEPPKTNYHKIKDTWDEKYGLSNVGYCQKCNKKITFDPLMYPNYDNNLSSDINHISVSNDKLLCVSCTNANIPNTQKTPFSFKYPPFFRK